MRTIKKPPAKKEKKASDNEERKVQMTPNKMCRDLLLERRYTDQQITDKVLTVFPGAKFTNAYVSTTRIDLNKGYYKNIEEDLEKNPIARLVEFEDKGIITIDAAKAFKAEKEAAEQERKAEERKVKKTGVRTDKRITGGIGEIKNAPKKGARKKPIPKGR